MDFFHGEKGSDLSGEIVQEWILLAWFFVEIDCHNVVAKNDGTVELLAASNLHLRLLHPCLANASRSDGPPPPGI